MKAATAKAKTPKARARRGVQHQLTDRECSAKREGRGRLSDGAGLYLSFSASGARSWVFVWTTGGRWREAGLGAYPATSLREARAKAHTMRTDVAAGRDPIAERRAEADRAKAEPTFGEVADMLLKAKAPLWRNQKHGDQWAYTLSRKRDEAGAPVRDGFCLNLVDRKVSEITVDDVLAVLEPIWQTKAETASRLRGRIERVLDFAKARKWRSGDNPAAWRGNLEALLASRQRLTRGHHRALPYDEMPEFMRRLRASNAIAARALEFAILTAARSGEVRGAVWSEIDFRKSLWTVPAVRMKAGEIHRVPLSGRALELLREMHAARTGDLVFPGAKGVPLSDMTLGAVLRRMKVDATAHGFRSSFRDWAGNETDTPRDVAELALAHQVGNATERAYRRGDAIEKRAVLMERWAAFVDGSKASV